MCSVNIAGNFWYIFFQKNQLSLLSEKGLGQAVQEFVDKAEKDAIKELINHQLERTQSVLRDRKATDENIMEQVNSYTSVI